MSNIKANVAELTDTGDLTVDTNTLKVVSATNRVGILTTTPDVTFQISPEATSIFGAGPVADVAAINYLNPTATKTALGARITVDGSNAPNDSWAIYGQVNYTSSAAATGVLSSIAGDTLINSAGNINWVTGIQGYVQKDGAGIVDRSAAVRAYGTYDIPTNTITNAFGVYVDSHANSGAVNSWNIFAEGPVTWNVNPFVVDGSNNVGIKTATPSEALQVVGNIRFSGALMPNNLPGTAGQYLISGGAGAPPTWATLTSPVTGTGTVGRVAYWGSSSSITSDADGFFWDATNNRLGLGTETPGSPFDLLTTTTATSGTNLGGKFKITAAPATTPTSANYRGILSQAFTSADATDHTTTTLYGIAAQSQHAGTGTLNIAYGANPGIFNTTTGTITSAIATAGLISNNTTGTITNAWSFQATIGNTGGGTIGTYTAFEAPGTSGTVTNYYGFRGQTPSNTGHYNLYMDGAAQNYLAGKLGIGTSTPVAKLDVVGTVRTQGAASSTITGTITPVASTSQTGSGTLFTTELIVGDRITVNGETRTVTVITSDTALTIDTAFTANASPFAITRLPALLTAKLTGVVAPKFVITDLGQVVIGTVVPDTNSYLRVFSSDTSTTGSRQVSLTNTVTASGTTGVNSAWYGLITSNTTFGAADYTLSTLYGHYASIAHGGSGTIGSVTGQRSIVSNANATGIVNNLSGYVSTLQNTVAGGNVVLATGFASNLATNAGTIGTYAGVDVTDPAGTITTIYGLRSRVLSTGGGTRYNIYADGSAQNYIKGSLGINYSAPIAKLEVSGRARFSSEGNNISLTGTVNPTASTTLTGTGTLFQTEIISGDRITVNGEARTVIAIASNTSLTVDTAFINTTSTTPTVNPAILVLRDNGNVPRVVVNDYGNIGIGTSAPTGRLQIDQPSTAPGTVTTNGTTTLVGVGTVFTDTFKVGDTITVSGETVRTITAVNNDLSLTVSVAFSTNTSSLTYSLTPGNRFIVKANGNVGIGVSTPNSTVQVNGSFAVAFSAKTANYTLTTTDSVISVDTDGGAVTITLPTAVGITGRQYIVKRITAGANGLTLATTSSQTIDGSTTASIPTQWQSLTVISNGSNWLIL